MKLLHVIKTLCTGGAELHLLTLARSLRSLGVEVVVGRIVDDHAWGTRLLNRDFEEAGIRILKLGGTRGSNTVALHTLMTLIRAERPDVVHTHLPRGDLLGALARACGARSPLVASVHDIHSRAQADRWGLSLVRWAWRRADAVIAISHAVGDWLARESGVSPSKIRVIHYGIDVEPFDKPRSSGPDRLLDATGPIIGCVGRLEERKGHDVLIRALPHILRRVPGARLRIAGNDPWGYGRTLRELSGSLNVSDRVDLVGFQSDVPAFLNSVDAFAFASRTEGFGQVVIEAMASGLPVVTSRIPPLTEIVVNGETGLLAEPDSPEAFAEAITAMLSNRDVALKMGETARSRVRTEFSAGRMARETLDIYERVTARSALHQSGVS